MRGGFHCLGGFVARRKGIILIAENRPGWYKGFTIKF